MRRIFKPTIAQRDEARRRFMVSAESLVCSARPGLKGRFDTLKLWDMLYYFHNIGKTPQEAAAQVLDYCKDK